ncbi:MAG: putative glycolipid-binding domain-containing protein [Actinomycetota bacterium]
MNSGRALVWELTEGSGIEIAFATLGSGHMSARGTALRSAPVPYRLDYELDTAADFVTRKLRVRSEGVGWRRALDLGRETEGNWSVDAEQHGEVDLPDAGGDPAPFQEGVDCDLGLSPLTNTMPVLRHNLLGRGGPLEFTMAWVSVPDLAVHASRQSYEHLRTQDSGAVVRYRSLDGTFTADISFDSDGFVIDYPGLARRVS